MATIPQGVKSVTTAGTRVQLQAASQPANGIVFQAKPTNTGNIYVGKSTVVGSTLVGCLYILTPGMIVSVGGKSACYDEDPALYYLDADVNGEGVVWGLIL